MTKRKPKKPQPTWHERFSADDLLGVKIALNELRDAAEAMQLAAGAEASLRAKSMPEFNGLYWLSRRVCDEATRAQTVLRDLLDSDKETLTT